MKHKMNIANAVTASRIVFAAFVLISSTFSVQFYVFYLLGGFSDMLDGWIARKRNLKSSFGAKFDTAADFMFAIVVLVKILPILYIPTWLWIWITIIAFIKFANLILSYLMFHRLISIHTVVNKITGLILFLLPFCVSSSSEQKLPMIFVFICSVATFAAIQEGHFIRIGKEIE